MLQRVTAAQGGGAPGGETLVDHCAFLDALHGRMVLLLTTRRAVLCRVRAPRAARSGAPSAPPLELMHSVPLELVEGARADAGRVTILLSPPRRRAPGAACFGRGAAGAGAGAGAGGEVQLYVRGRGGGGGRRRRRAAAAAGRAERCGAGSTRGGSWGGVGTLARATTAASTCGFPTRARRRGLPPSSAPSRARPAGARASDPGAPRPPPRGAASSRPPWLSRGTALDGARPPAARAALSGAAAGAARALRVCPCTPAPRRARRGAGPAARGGWLAGTRASCGTV